MIVGLECFEVFDHIDVMKHCVEWLRALERPRILSKGDSYLDSVPISVTASRCERSAGGVNDFYSEGDYWWPNPEDADGPFVRRDGETYPGLFVAHRETMVRLSEIVGTMASAFLLTGDEAYASVAVEHLRAWFVVEKTRMNPSLLYGQAIRGISTGRSIGLIDTLHLIEVARGAKVLAGANCFSKEDQGSVMDWFRTYLKWMNEHPYGQEERVHPNNHGVCWSLQAAVFGDLVGDAAQVAWVREQFKTVYLGEMMGTRGGFPEELARTKPYGYSLFVVDAMAGIAQVVSTAADDLWSYCTADGRGMRLGASFIAPFVRDKSSWPLAPDVLHWDDWPVRQPILLLGGLALGEQSYIDLWEGLEADPKVFEVLRNLPIRHPLLWVGLD